MARRARSSLKPAWLLAGLGAVLLLVAAGGYFLGPSHRPFGRAPEFPVAEYLQSSSPLRGNSYRLSGAVLNSLAWSPSTGRLISVQPSGHDAPVPVLLPPELGEANIQKGQRFHFLVEVRENGILHATGMTKS
jgi:hypothetical protein